MSGRIAECSSGQNLVSTDVAQVDVIVKLLQGDADAHGDGDFFDGRIFITLRVRITLQEFDDHIYLRNIGGHEILP